MQGSDELRREGLIPSPTEAFLRGEDNVIRCSETIEEKWSKLVRINYDLGIIELLVIKDKLQYNCKIIKYKL